MCYGNSLTLFDQAQTSEIAVCLSFINALHGAKIAANINFTVYVNNVPRVPFMIKVTSIILSKRVPPSHAHTHAPATHLPYPAINDEWHITLALQVHIKYACIFELRFNFVGFLCKWRSKTLTLACTQVWPNLHTRFFEFERRHGVRLGQTKWVFD